MIGIRHSIGLGLLLAVSGCVKQSERSAPVAIPGEPSALVLVASRTDDPDRFTSLLPRTLEMLGDRELATARGEELGVRTDPDGRQVVFARQLDDSDPDSTELFLASLDDGQPEVRLTFNGDPDLNPCFAADGTTVIFAANRGPGLRLHRVSVFDQEGSEWIAAAPGVIDRQPHANPTDGRVVFCRFDPALGRNRLMIMQSDGLGLVPLTDGGTGIGPGAGDTDPTFSRDGATVWFVRRGAGPDQLLRIEVATSTIVPLPLPAGYTTVAAPRPGTDGRLLLACMAAPDLGRPGLRPHLLGADGTPPALLLPDQRFTVPAAEPLPGAELPTLALPVPANVRDRSGLSLFGQPALGNETLLEDADGSPWILASTPFSGREVAAIQLELRLPVANALDVGRMRFRVVAALRRPGNGNVLKMALFNVLERRFDTVVELTPATDGYMTLEADIAGLAYVSSNRRALFEVVMDVDDAATTELWVDQMLLEVTPRVR